MAKRRAVTSADLSQAPTPLDFKPLAKKAIFDANKNDIFAKQRFIFRDIFACRSSLDPFFCPLQSFTAFSSLRRLASLFSPDRLASAPKVHFLRIFLV
jgi:hypothetical protein